MLCGTSIQQNKYFEYAAGRENIYGRLYMKIGSENKLAHSIRILQLEKLNIKKNENNLIAIGDIPHYFFFTR